MTIPRRQLLRLAAGAGALAAAPRAARAQAYPSRPITLMVFVGPGGAPDIIARIVAQTLSQRLGQPVLIENRPGAGGNLALQAVARAPADGHTLLLLASPHFVNVTLYEKSPVNVVRDIVPVASINGDAFVMVVSPSKPYRTVADFIAHAKANPGKVNMTSSGSGNLTHLCGELFRMATGTELVHVPYRNSPAALAAIMANEIDVMFDALPSSLPHVQSGRLRALGVTSATRRKPMPDVPAIAETVPGYAVTGWLGVGAPKGTPVEIVERLNREINATLADPEAAAKLLNIGTEPFSSSPAEVAKLIAEDVDKWAKVVRFANLKVE